MFNALEMLAREDANMLITHEREKLMNSIIYFVQNTPKCEMIKLFKLLYLLDFTHFKMTGRSVTGLDYYAEKIGPVPLNVHEKLDLLEYEYDLLKKININKTLDGLILTCNPEIKFDIAHFSKRELQIMENLAQEYKYHRANKITEASHLENQPWDKIFNHSKYKQKEKQIPYELAVPEKEYKKVMAIAKEHQQIIGSLRGDARVNFFR